MSSGSRERDAVEFGEQRGLEGGHGSALVPLRFPLSDGVGVPSTQLNIQAVEMSSVPKCRTKHH